MNKAVSCVSSNSPGHKRFKAPLMPESSALYVSRDVACNESMKLSGRDYIALGKTSKKIRGAWVPLWFLV